MMDFDSYYTFWMDRIVNERKEVDRVSPFRLISLCWSDYKRYRSQRTDELLVPAAAARAAETRTGSISVVNTPLHPYQPIENKCVLFSKK